MNEPTTLAEIEAALVFSSSFEGRAVRRILDTGLKHALEPYLAYLLSLVDEEERRIQADESYW